MRTGSYLLCFLFVPLFLKAQPDQTDSLRRIFLGAENDSILYKSAILLYDHYEELNRDSAYFYAKQAVSLSRRNNKKLNEAYSLNRQAYQEINLGRLEAALNNLLNAFSIAENKENEDFFWEIDPLRTEKNKRLYVLSTTHHIFAILMYQTGNREEELVHFRAAKRIAVEINNSARSLLGSLNLGRIYQSEGKPDSALLFINEAEEIALSSGRKRYLATIFQLQGKMWMDKGDTSRALYQFYKSIEIGKEQGNSDGMIRAYNAVFEYHLARNNNDSALYYAKRKLETMKNFGAISSNDYNIGTAYESLYRVYDQTRQYDSAYKYLRLSHSITDSINRERIQSLSDFQNLTLTEQQKMQNAENERISYRNKVRTNIMLAGIGVLLLLAIIFYFNNRQKQKAKHKVEQAYDNLKATQQQLIHSEKMASLGELTAGIAHEIQNPLNFVNNFSEVSAELLDEMKEQLAMGNMQQVNEIALDVIQNLEKILHHGRRADEIVKGMLQHSRNSNGQKEPTDLNSLADEYLRLAFHGWRAKDKSFNADLKTDFDNGFGKISMVPQDIGRVLLNLLNNAFYAVNEKSNSKVTGYLPLVTVSTKAKNDSNRVELRVADNGNGISTEVIDKIFQPFFTTKPTGKGTGLGLSLSYDIIKAHGGEMKVETRVGSGTTFILDLPK